MNSIVIPLVLYCHLMINVFIVKKDQYKVRFILHKLKESFIERRK